MTEQDETMAIARASRIIEIMGGVQAVCAITGRSRTRVYSWTYTRDNGGTGGMIPPQMQLILLKHARENAIDLTPDHFFPPVEAVTKEDAA